MQSGDLAPPLLLYLPSSVSFNGRLHYLTNGLNQCHTLHTHTHAQQSHKITQVVEANLAAHQSGPNMHFQQVTQKVLI